MRELMATNDLVLLSFIEALLRDAEIECVVVDGFMSILEGSIGAIPRRLLVAADQWDQAARVLQDAELGHWIAANRD
jgi:hypothetical protein